MCSRERTAPAILEGESALREHESERANPEGIMRERDREMIMITSPIHN